MAVIDIVGSGTKTWYGTTHRLNVPFGVNRPIQVLGIVPVKANDFRCNDISFCVRNLNG